MKELYYSSLFSPHIPPMPSIGSHLDPELVVSSNYGFGWVSSIAFYNGEIYAAGIFDSAGEFL
jgi:hypothetical protein